MSIHPQFASEILAGRKKVEFRRKRLHPDVSLVMVYATAPIKRIVGSFKVGGVDVGTPNGIWRKYRQVAGVRPREYHGYYAGAKKAFAIKVVSPKALEREISVRKLLTSGRAPQSFCYCSARPAERLALGR
jgi:predicted transcriptional regulator